MTDEETAIAAAKTAAELWLRRRPWIAAQDHADLKQESAIAALAAVKTYRADKGASLKTWCSAKAKWKLSELAMTHAKRTKKRGILAHLVDEIAPPHFDRGPHLVDAALDAETVVRTLSPRRAEIMRRIASGRSVDEVAADLGITKSGAAQSIMLSRKVAAARFPELACRYGVA